MSAVIHVARRMAVTAAVGCMFLAASVSAPGEDNPGRTAPELTAALREVIGDSSVVVSRFYPEQKGAYYVLAVPGGKRWELDISDPLPDEQAAHEKFEQWTRVPVMPWPSGNTSGPGYDRAEWGGPNIVVRRGMTVAAIKGSSAITPEDAERKAAALDRLLQTGEVQRKLADAEHAAAAFLEAANHPKPTPTPTPPPPPDPGTLVFLKGDPDIIPFLRQTLRGPVAGPLTDETWADATVRREAVEGFTDLDLDDLARCSALPLLKRIAANKNEYPTVRAAADTVIQKIEARKKLDRPKERRRHPGAKG